MKQLSIATSLAWVRSNYERALLLVAAIFLCLSAAQIVRSSLRFEADFCGPLVPAGRASPPSSNLEEIEAALVELGQPAQWTFEGRSGLFVPEKHFINAEGYPATLRTTQVHPPIPNQWFVDFGLPIANAAVLEQDPDEDGFSNLEEWKSQTNPVDAGSHPLFASKLRLKEFEEEALRIVFASRVGDTFGVNITHAKEATQFLKLGDSIRGTKFILTGFHEVLEKNKYGTRVDVSELLLENGETKEQIKLIKEQTAEFPQPVAKFIYLWSGRFEFTVRKDQQFSLNPETQIKYKLIDVQPGKAVIANIQTPNELIEIQALSP